MTRKFYFLFQLPLLATALGLALAGSIALAPPPPDVPLPRQNPFEVSIHQFDQRIFGGSRNAAQGRKKLESFLTLQVKSIDRVCKLSDAQKQKLQLAGRGDIKKFYDSVDVTRKKFLLVRHDRNKINQIWRETNPLRSKLQSGIFDDASLVHKILKRTLDSRQTVTYKQSERERRQFRHEATIGLVVEQLESGIPLLDQQRRKLVKLLVEKTDPPKKFGQYDYHVVMFQASKLPKGELTRILDQAQMHALSKHFQRAKGMERHLRTNGLIP